MFMYGQTHTHTPRRTYKIWKYFKIKKSYKIFNKSPRRQNSKNIQSGWDSYSKT